MADDEIRTGLDLFNATDDQFKYWYADAYGIHSVLYYSDDNDLSLERAKQVRDELTEIIEFCEQYENEFCDL